VLKRFLAQQLLFLLAVSGVCAQTPTIFPSNSKDPRRSDGAALLQAVCPGAVAVGKEIGCAVKCPDYTDFKGDPFDWSLKAVIVGHFLSPTSDDAALAMVGCESHGSNFGGTILLTKRSGKWKMLWYKAGVTTEECHKVVLADRRELLACIGSDGAQGNMETSLYVEDLRDPRTVLMAARDDDGTFFSALDDTATCGWPQDADKPDVKPVQASHIERVEFPTDAKGTPGVAVTATLGRKQLTRAEVDECMANTHDPRVPGRIYQMHFVLDGGRFKATPTSADTVKMFGTW
jgi:hypothetical protein